MAAILATIRLAGVTPEVNLRNLLHTGDKEHTSERIYHGFETQGTSDQKSKRGVSVAPQKGLTSSKKFLKKDKTTPFGKRNTTRNLKDR